MLVGSEAALGTSTWIFTTGQAKASTTATVTIRTLTGCAITHSDQRRQKRPSRPAWPNTRSESTRGPRTPIRAGSSVKAAATENSTTSEPPRPIERSAMYLKVSRPSMPTITARPLKKMERPARATVVSTASATVAPSRNSSRKRPTMKRA